VASAYITEYWQPQGISHRRLHDSARNILSNLCGLVQWHKSNDKPGESRAQPRAVVDQVLFGEPTCGQRWRNCALLDRNRRIVAYSNSCINAGCHANLFNAEIHAQYRTECSAYSCNPAKLLRPHQHAVGTGAGTMARREDRRVNRVARRSRVEPGTLEGAHSKP
jgi:hypothetical protein